MLQLVLIFTVSIRLSSVAAGTANLFTIHDSLYPGYTFKKLKGVSWLDCLENCFADSRCRSYNYFQNSKGGQTITCELSEHAFESRCEAEERLISVSSWIYHQIKTNRKINNVAPKVRERERERERESKANE